MLVRISNSVSRWLHHSGAIADDEVPIYAHALYCFIFTVIPFVLVSAIGLVLGMFHEGILMIVPFYLLRRFSGGFHLKSSTVCFLSSTCLLAVLLLCVEIVLRTEQYALFSVCVAISTGIVFVFSPIDSAERLLSVRERKIFRRVARFLVAVIVGITMLLMHFGRYAIAVPVGMGLVITALLQIPCLFRSLRNALGLTHDQNIDNSVV